MRLTVRAALRAMIARGDLTSAGRCMARGYIGRSEWITYHDRAPQGVSFCEVCGRQVLRGFGAWWDAP